MAVVAAHAVEARHLEAQVAMAMDTARLAAAALSQQAESADRAAGLLREQVK
jgi:hypothetical protein